MSAPVQIIEQPSLFEGIPSIKVITRLRVPPRVEMRHPPRQEPEADEQMQRVCPVCYSKLFWRVVEKFLRFEEHESTGDAAQDEALGIEWVPEMGKWGIARYGEYWEPRCHICGRLDNWLVYDNRKAMLVAAANIDEGGDLFKFPARATRRLAARAITGRPSPFGGRKAGGRNKPKAAVVQDGVQANFQIPQEVRL